MEKAKRTLKIVLNVFIWIFVVFAIFITVLVISAQNSADGVPEIGGKCVINILSDSMSPTIKSGDIIIGRKLSESEKQNLKKDDVITFYADLNGDGKTELNTHRIKEVNLSSSSSVISYTTNGDNNLAEDTEAVTTDRIISIWTEKRIGRVGSVIGFLQTSTGFLVVIVIPLILFFAYEMYRFIKTLISVKNSGKKQITEADEEEIKRRAVEEYLKQQEETNQQQDTGEDANT
ncbi:MAG: signal peptidase I [Eubacteriales bacterium]|nr:signal peptidase I [Eubacteriales bacterium]MDD4422385.1 signal peptidase I [Eubacteriales bacterium]HBR31142.1 signal peptidase I [Clostridiales bacterium]